MRVYPRQQIAAALAGAPDSMSACGAPNGKYRLIAGDVAVVATRL